MKKVRIGKSKIKGKGVFAEENIKKGEKILMMSGEQVSDARMDTYLAKKDLRWDDPFEIGDGKYILLDELPLRINHSCDPSAGLRKKNELFALRNIKKGEELSYDYSTVVGENAPDESDWNMRCNCGAEICRKKIGNWQTLPPRRLNFYKKVGALPAFILKQIARAS